MIEKLIARKNSSCCEIYEIRDSVSWIDNVNNLGPTGSSSVSSAIGEMIVPCSSIFINLINPHPSSFGRMPSIVRV